MTMVLKMGLACLSPVGACEGPG